jgi:LacI family transcriptional regulator
MDLLRMPERPTALFCFKDTMAMGVYDAVKKLGLAIPEDIAIVGFDNHELIAAELYPPLTSMELPHYAMGQWAVQYLLEHADSSPVPPVQHTIPCRLVERESA